MAAISYHNTVKDLQGLAFADRGPFSRPDWFAMLEQAGSRPAIALVRDGADALALPLAQGKRGLIELSNWYAFTWRDLSTSPAARDRLMDSLARDLRTRASRVILDRLPDEDGTASCIERAFRRAGWLVSREICNSNHVLPLAGRDYATYFAGLPGPLRTTIKRKRKKLTAQILTDFDELAWQTYERIYQESWKGEEGDSALLRQFAQQEGEAGRIRLALAFYEDQPIAAQFWTVEKGTAYIHKLAHIESAAPFSAGTVLTAALMEHVIDRDGVAWVDFGTGDDPYKRDWMKQARPRYRLTCWIAAEPRNWPEMGKFALQTLVSRLRAG